MKNIYIILKDAYNHNDYNKRIIEYLNDRYEYINDAEYKVNIDIINDSNIDDYVKKGIESVPALIIDDYIEHGVNSIISKLSKLEDDKPINNKPKESEILNTDSIVVENKNIDDDTFYKKAMEQMLNLDDDDDDISTPIKIRNQDIESPMDDKYIENQKQKFQDIMSERNRKNTNLTPKPKSTKKNDLYNTIAKESYDKGEEGYMRQIIEDMNS